MPFTDVTEATLITKIVAILRADLTLNNRQCFKRIGTDPPKIPRGGDYIVTVGYAGGQFPFGEQAIAQAREEARLHVTGHTRVGAQDSTDNDQEAMFDAERGLYKIKRDILKSMLAADPDDGAGNKILASNLYAISCEEPRFYSHQQENYLVGSITLMFGVDFDHELTT